MDREHQGNIGLGQEASLKCVGSEGKSGFKKWKDLFREGYEIAEMVFGLIDIESFLACRLVCQDWRSAVNIFQPKWREVKGTSLIKAVKSNQELVAEVLIANGADVLARHKRRLTALHWAAQNGLTSTAELLLVKGAKLEATDMEKRTPLFVASEKGQLAMVEMLIAHNANIEAKGSGGMTPLAAAAHVGEISCVQALIAKGANVLAKCSLGCQPLHWASSHDDPYIANMLIANGANVHARDDMDGMTPLMEACESGSPAVAQLLISFGAEVNATDNINKTPLDYANCWRLEELFRGLENHGGKTMMQISADFDRGSSKLGSYTEVVKVLANNGGKTMMQILADVGILDKDKKIPSQLRPYDDPAIISISDAVPRL